MTNYFPKLLITGGQGQLGQALCAHSDCGGFEIHAASHTEMDITDASSIHAAIEKWTPDVIINTAAYTAVHKAEEEHDLALQVNQLGAQNLAIACHENHIPLIHLSTDYVFDGLTRTPYTEDHAVNPQNVYGESKWLGEQAIREHCEQHIILRVSAVFSEYGHNFLKTILKLALQQPELNIVSDQITCPTYAGHIAGVIYSLVKELSAWGTYHYCDTPPASWYQFTQAIVSEAQNHTQQPLAMVNAIPASEYVSSVQRPPFSVLDCTKIMNTYHIQPMPWQDAVNRIVPLLLSNMGK